jgi:2-methylisocitrate lyase-like PEP mutase family enzyme
VVVTRLSLATSLYRNAMTALSDAAREVHSDGSFGYLECTMSTADFNRLIQG